MHSGSAALSGRLPRPENGPDPFPRPSPVSMLSPLRLRRYLDALDWPIPARKGPESARGTHPPGSTRSTGHTPRPHAPERTPGAGHAGSGRIAAPSPCTTVAKAVAN